MNAQSHMHTHKQQYKTNLNVPWATGAVSAL